MSLDLKLIVVFFFAHHELKVFGSLTTCMQQSIPPIREGCM